MFRFCLALLLIGEPLLASSGKHPDDKYPYAFECEPCLKIEGELRRVRLLISKNPKNRALKKLEGELLAEFLKTLK